MMMKRKTAVCFALIAAAAIAVTAAGGVFGRKAGAAAMLSASDLFTSRDLKQEADLTGATILEVSDGAAVSVTEGGVYILRGSAENAVVTVETGSEDKVQLVLDGVHITNESAPCIRVVNADKVFVTTTGSENSLAVTGGFSGSEDAVIYSKDDLVLSGKGTLTVTSSKNAVSSRNDLKITGGTLIISCADAALEGQDSVCVADGVIDVSSCVDGLHSENSSDNTLGYVYVGGGVLRITCEDDAVHANSVVQIDGGDLTLTGREGIEGTFVQLNGGRIVINASDDGINAGRKSSAYTPTVEINGGSLTITGTADTCDGVDANGNIVINGGTVEVNAANAFDCDGNASYNGGTVIVNGETVNAIPL